MGHESITSIYKYYGINFISTLLGKPKIIKLPVPVQPLKFANETIIYTLDKSELSPNSSLIKDPSNNDTYTYTGMVYEEFISYTVSQINPETNQIEIILPPSDIPFTILFTNYTQNTIDNIPLNQGNIRFNKILFDGEIWQFGTISSNEFTAFIQQGEPWIQYELGNYRFFDDNGLLEMGGNGGNGGTGGNGGAGGNLKTLWSFNENHLLNKTKLLFTYLNKTKYYS